MSEEQNKDIGKSDESANAPPTKSIPETSPDENSGEKKKSKFSLGRVLGFSFLALVVGPSVAYLINDSEKMKNLRGDTAPETEEALKIKYDQASIEALRRALPPQASSLLRAMPYEEAKKYAQRKTDFSRSPYANYSEGQIEKLLPTQRPYTIYQTEITSNPKDIDPSRASGEMKVSINTKYAFTPIPKSEHTKDKEKLPPNMDCFRVNATPLLPGGEAAAFDCIVCADPNGKKPNALFDEQYKPLGGNGAQKKEAARPSGSSGAKPPGKTNG